jgi:cytochrome P450
MLFDQHFDTDTAFQVNFIALFRNLKYWKDPKVFNPDRFDDLQEDCYFVPFGDGPMKCIGFRMAMIEMKLLVAKICIAFNMTLEPQKLVAVTSITHGLKNGLKVRLHKIE